MSQSTTGLIYSKMAAILKATKAIGKNRENKQQGYNFRGIDEVYNELHDIFAENGVFPLSEVLEMKREERSTKSGGFLMYTIVTVKFTFMAEDGSSVTSIMVGEGMDSGDKSCNKAMSGALKYALMQTFLIPTKEKKDAEEDNPDPETKAAQLKKECLLMISQAQTVADLSDIKKKYYPLFTDANDKEVPDAATEKYNSITKKLKENGAV